ncbi:hypothetical protein WN51_12104 [Melipona quadrifasciata]|uniref:Uncharacterized protein n=1 Tax=Melipona quadrifasciata TaxID=166423 RepID=A0A0M9A5L0_9HYME|nr:hypothetical protein WN51_12104 [Melipona quadrifasciata]
MMRNGSTLESKLTRAKRPERKEEAMQQAKTGRGEKDGRTRGEGSMPVARATTVPDLHPSWTILLSPAPFTGTNWDEVSSRMDRFLEVAPRLRLKPKRGKRRNTVNLIQLSSSNLDLVYTSPLLDIDNGNQITGVSRVNHIWTINGNPSEYNFRLDDRRSMRYLNIVFA